MPYFFGLLDFQVFILVVGYTLKNSICLRKFSSTEKKGRIFAFKLDFLPQCVRFKGKKY